LQGKYSFEYKKIKIKFVNPHRVLSEEKNTHFSVINFRLKLDGRHHQGGETMADCSVWESSRKSTTVATTAEFILVWKSGEEELRSGDCFFFHARTI